LSGRGLLVLVVLLGVAIAVVVFVDRVPREEKKAETLDTLVPLKLEAVSALERERGGELLRLERDGQSAWRVARPVAAEADPRQVKALYEMALGARIRRVVEEKATDLNPFGLDSPALRLRFFPKDESAAAVEIAVGRSSPVGTGRYAGTAAGKVLLVDGLAGGTLDQDAGSFVEKRLFPAEPDEIRSISLEHGAGRLSLVRDGAEWRLEAPVADAADSASVETLTRSLGQLAFSRLLEEPEALTARAGLSRPAVRARLEGSAAHPAMEASIAATGPGEDRYACRENGRCGVVAASALRDLERPADDYRDRRLMTAAAGEIREIDLKSGAGELRVVRTGTGEDAASWSVQEGKAEALSADPARVEALLDRLGWLRASSFEDPSHVPSLGVSLVLTGEKGELGRLEFSSEASQFPAKEGEPAQRRLYARSSWRPGILFTVPADGLGSLPRSAADLTRKGSEPGSSTGTP